MKEQNKKHYSVFAEMLACYDIEQDFYEYFDTLKEAEQYCENLYQAFHLPAWQISFHIYEHINGKKKDIGVYIPKEVEEYLIKTGSLILP